MPEDKEVKAANPSPKKKKTTTITVKANKKGKHRMFLMAFLRVVALPVYFLLKPFRVYGKRKVADGACIYICNHYSMFDPAYVVTTTWEGIHFIAKREAFKIPVIGWIMRRVKCISVNRDGNDVRGLLDAMKCLKNNEKICIFPEGTRNTVDGDFLPFRPGAAIMSIKTKTPIVPIVICSRPRLFRCTHILVGEPFELSEYYNQKPTDEEILKIDESLRQRMVDMRKEHFELLASKKRKGNVKA